MWNQHVVDTINRGQVHIVEPELDIIVHAAITGGFLRATTMAEPADAFLIAVPTPFTGDHEPDLSYIESASTSVAQVLKKGDLVILESTSPVGGNRKNGRVVSRRTAGSYISTIAWGRVGYQSRSLPRKGAPRACNARISGK